MKTIFFLFIILISNVNASCVENYSPDGKFLGCTIQKVDKIANSKWLSPVVNNYSGGNFEGVSYFEIDSAGGYTGHTIIRRPNEDCVRYDPGGWKGKLYRIESNTYTAWNEGVYDAFYLINMTNDGLIASSYLIGGKDIKNISERNDFFRKDKKFNFENILKVYEPFICK